MNCWFQKHGREDAFLLFYFIYFFIFGGHKSFFETTDSPVCGDVCPGFQSQGRFLVCFLACVILRFTSGATLADCIETFHDGVR